MFDMKNILALVFLMMFSLTADAQFGGLLKRKAKQKAEEERDREIDNALDKTANDIRDFFKKKNKKEEPAAAENEDSEFENQENTTEDSGEEKSKSGIGFDLGSLFGNREKVDIADKYSFDFAVTWEMETEKGKETTYTQYFPNEGMFISTSIAGVESIVDFERNVSISFIENIATVINLNLNPENLEAQTEEQNEANFEFRKTGKTKEIAGYKVEQFTFKTEDSSGEVWATDELSFNRASILGMMKNNPEVYGISEADAPGMVLEIITTDDKNKTIKMLATEVKEELRTIDMSQYQVMNMGGLGNK